MSSDILIIDDEEDIRNLVKGILEDEGYQTRAAANAKEAYEEIKKSEPSLIVLDIWLRDSEQDGMEILESVKQDHPNLPVVMISGHGTIETAVKAIQKGAYDFIEKPFKTDRLIMMIERALENAQLRAENAALKKKNNDIGELITHSQAMQTLQQLIERAAPSNSRILLTGEAGTGKDLIARIIHKSSNRANEAFLALNCATLRPDHLETELFGSDKDSKIKVGLLEQTNKGTLFLDEVGDMPLETQGKIVRVLQEQIFKKVGGDSSIEVDVRVIASTSQDLKEAVENGSFRQDLYYRLNVVPIHVPSLSERALDISDLANYFLALLSDKDTQEIRGFSDEALAAMQIYDWPGNVRQLRNVVESIFIMGDKSSTEPFSLRDLPPEISKISPDKVQANTDTDFLVLPLREAREMFERNYLISQVNRFGGNISKTAQFIGMERSAFHRKLKSLGVAANEKDDNKKEKRSA